MANKKYFDYIGSVWENLPMEDQSLFGETWHGYEQVLASVYQEMVENDLNIAVQDLQQYRMKRWLPYFFTDENLILSSPTYKGTQDLSVGIRTDIKNLIRFQFNDNPPLEANIMGLNPLSTTIEEIITRLNNTAGFKFAKAVVSNSLIQLTGPAPTPDNYFTILPASDPSRDASEFVLGLGLDELPRRFPEFPFQYPLPYQDIVGIPKFRTHVRDNSDGLKFLTSGTDFVLNNGTIQFKLKPPPALWAKKTFIDQETPWNNFGYLMGIYQKNTPSYLSIVQGLWYAFWTGPKPDNVRAALYLLFGLPISLTDGTIVSVTTTTITMVSDDGVTTQFEIPSELISLVVVGQRVTKYTPLVDGIDVFDKISLPGFVTEEIGRPGIQRFLLDEATRGSGDTDETKALTMLEEHTFLPQISVNSFISPDINLRNVKIFLDNIKPLSKTYMFQVIVGSFRDEVILDDRIVLDISMDVTPNLDSNQTTFAESQLLEDNEIVVVDGMTLDTEGAALRDELEVEVYSFGSIIDSFVI